MKIKWLFIGSLFLFSAPFLAAAETPQDKTLSELRACVLKDDVYGVMRLTHFPYKSYYMELAQNVRGELSKSQFTEAFPVFFNNEVRQALKEGHLYKVTKKDVATSSCFKLGDYVLVNPAQPEPQQQLVFRMFGGKLKLAESVSHAMAGCGQLDLSKGKNITAKNSSPGIPHD